MNMTYLTRAAVILLAGFACANSGAALAQKPQKQAKEQKQPQAKEQKQKEQKPKKDPSEQAVLLGQFGDWGAYKAEPGGKKVCFALSKPTSAVSNPPGRSRDPSYAFVSTRPAEKVKNEVSVIVGYPQKTGFDATAVIGTANYVLYTQDDGAWVKNAADEPKMVDAMRKGSELIIKSESSHGTRTTDTYSLKGISEALDKVAEECK